jgi:class 3 adenylate cyclase
MNPDLPTGTVTFLFTDIEGSTKLWQQHPDAMPNALACHHTILNETIAAHGGYVFQIIGDAFCAAFSTAIDGLEAALRTRQLRDATGTKRRDSVWMALHTGTADVRVGEHTSGESFRPDAEPRGEIARRTRRQILLSLPTAELRDHLPPKPFSAIWTSHRSKI